MITGLIKWSSSEVKVEVCKMGVGARIDEAKEFWIGKRRHWVEVKAFGVEMCSLGDFMKVAADVVGVKANKVCGREFPIQPSPSMVLFANTSW